MQVKAPQRLMRCGVLRVNVSIQTTSTSWANGCSSDAASAGSTLGSMSEGGQPRMDTGERSQGISEVDLVPRDY
jgi:hypothetical protein